MSAEHGSETGGAGFDSIASIIEDIRLGRMVVIVDDEDRENEGDLVMAASAVRPEDINFMARHARGLICLSLTRQRCEQLRLPMMVSDNRSSHGTNFTVSIEAAEGVTTGISAYDRAHTVQTAVRKTAVPDDLSMPGHIFPLMAQPGGVLTRAGHTEASVDLASLAGLEPAGVIVEILNDDGTMARRPELEVFARAHGLKIGTIADLIAYRLQNEKTVHRVYDEVVQNEFGEFRLVAYRDFIDKALHFAMVCGEVHASAPMLVRVHVKNVLSDVLHIQRDDFGVPVASALAQVAVAGGGIVVVLADGAGADPEVVLQRLQGRRPDDADRHRPGAEWRRNGLGAQILADLGVRQMRVIGTPKRFFGLAGYGLEVVDYVEPMALAATSESGNADH